jgi:hypothetical protein
MQDLKQRHQRLCHYSKGMILDINEILGEYKVIYMTAIDDTHFS